MNHLETPTVVPNISGSLSPATAHAYLLTQLSFRVTHARPLARPRPPRERRASAGTPPTHPCSSLPCPPSHAPRCPLKPCQLAHANPLRAGERRKNAARKRSTAQGRKFGGKSGGTAQASQPLPKNENSAAQREAERVDASRAARRKPAARWATPENGSTYRIHVRQRWALPRHDVNRTSVGPVFTHLSKIKGGDTR